MNFEEFKERYQKVQVEEYPNNVPDSPMVSVCVQTYQHAAYIRECLDSILMQRTNFLYEILLGEDASTDGTREICIEYAEKYPDKIRLFLHHRENNIQILGIPTGRFNTLTNLFSSKGKYIAFCEGDDYWVDPTKLQKQYDFMNSNTEYVVCSHDAFILKGEKIISQSKLPDKFKKDFTGNEAKNGIFILTLSIFFKNIRSYPEEFMNIINLDTFLIIYLGNYGHFKYLGGIKPACYRIHEGGMWSAKTQNRKEISDINTHFWISKYFERIGNHELKNHHGMKVAVNSIRYLIDSRSLNIIYLMRFALSHKYNRLYFSLHRIKKYIRSKLHFI